MKPRLLLATILLSCAGMQTQAQNTSPYWSLAGNSGTGTTAKLGTYGPDTLNLISNNQRRVSVMPTGQVLFGLPSTSSHPVYGNLTIMNLNNYAGGIGLYSTGQATTGLQGEGTSYGVIGSGLGSGGYGVGGSGSMAGLYGSSDRYGVYGTTSTGYAVYGYSGSYGWGGYFQSQTGSAIVARTYQTNGNWAGIFYGNVYTSGTYTTSDKRLKKNITEFEDASALLHKLKPRTYEFSHEGKLARMNLPQGKHWGLIAQDVETVFPSLVAEVPAYAGLSDQPDVLPNLDPASTSVSTPTSSTVASLKTAPGQETIKVVNYTELISILIKAVQEQDDKIQTLEKTVEDLKAAVERNGVAYLSGAYLEVPAPNPAKTSTIVRYSIPGNSASARLSVVNMADQVIKEMTLTGKTGQVELNVSNLASGVYPCTLWVNGQQAVSKQLLIAR